MNKRALFGSVAAVFVLGAASMANAEEIKVGFVTSMSGPVSSLGIPYSKGVAAGAAAISEIDGNPIKLIQLDDASDPSAAARNARKLVEEDNVDILIGSAGSPAALAIAAVAAELKVPLISIANANPQGEAGAWTVTIPQPAPLMVGAVTKHMQANGVKKVAYVGFSVRTPRPARGPRTIPKGRLPRRPSHSPRLAPASANSPGGRSPPRNRRKPSHACSAGPAGHIPAIAR
jgi:branched-chain amino acid transport system substrate-binding protein